MLFNTVFDFLKIFVYYAISPFRHASPSNNMLISMWACGKIHRENIRKGIKNEKKFIYIDLQRIFEGFEIFEDSNAEQAF